MGVLLLVRHGQASMGAADYDQLSDLGRRQARATGTRLAAADLAIDRVMCGALTRQRDTTAEIMAMLPDTAHEAGPERAEFGPHIDDRLDEYDHVGVLTGLFGAGGAAGGAGAAVGSGGVDPAEPNRGLQPALDEAIARWATADAGYGESHDAFLDRVHAVLDDLAGAPGCSLAVTSGGVIAVACVQVLGLPTDRWPVLARIIVNGSVTKIIKGRTGTNLLTFNDYAHLEGDRSLVTYR
jgi:broad specificity phosphatase PhoE